MSVWMSICRQKKLIINTQTVDKVYILLVNERYNRELFNYERESLHFSSLERRKTKQKEVQDFSMQLDGKDTIILSADTKSKLLRLREVNNGAFSYC